MRGVADIVWLHSTALPLTDALRGGISDRSGQFRPRDIVVISAADGLGAAQIKSVLQISKGLVAQQVEIEGYRAVPLTALGE